MGSGLALSSTLSREALVGREEPSSRLDVIVRPLYIMQHAPDGSPIGRALRVLLLKEDGIDAEGQLARYSPWERERRRRMVLRLRVVQVTPR